MCEVLEVSRSGFYAWRSRPESKRSKHHRELIEEIRKIHGDRDMKSYGSPRVHKELLARGIDCSENTVATLMRSHGLAAKTRRKYRITTDSSHTLPVAENVLNREFFQDTPDRVWLADITFIWTMEGWLYARRRTKHWFTVAVRKKRNPSLLRLSLRGASFVRVMCQTAIGRRRDNVNYRHSPIASKRIEFSASIVLRRPSRP